MEVIVFIVYFAILLVLICLNCTTAALIIQIITGKDILHPKNPKNKKEK